MLDPRPRVVVGGPRANRYSARGPWSERMLAAVRASQKVVFFVAKFDKPDMETLRELLEAGVDVGHRKRVTLTNRRRSRVHGDGHRGERSSSRCDAAKRCYMSLASNKASP